MIFRTCGVVMLLSLVCIVVYSVGYSRTDVAKLNPILVFESVALFAFGISWLVKGNTLFRDRPERRE